MSKAAVETRTPDGCPIFATVSSSLRWASSESSTIFLHAGTSVILSGIWRAICATQTRRTTSACGKLLTTAALIALLTPMLPAQSRPQLFFDQLGPMFVDVDGAPNAYGPPGKTALDFEKNAHKGAKLSGKIVGYLTERDHRTPVIQGPHDPKPGYYVSTTDFRDEAIGPTGLEIDDRNPRKYLDATKIRYVVLGSFGKRHDVKMGDFAVVHSLRTHRTVYAIVGDSGNPSGYEGSLALLQALGYPFKDGKDDAVEEREIVIRYFPGSNPTHHFFHTQQEIDEAAEALHLDRKF